VLRYLLLCREDSLQRKHDLRSVFNAVRYVARTGGQWRHRGSGLYRYERRRSGRATRPAARVVKSHGKTRLRPLAATMVVELSFAWAARFRRLARDYERLAPHSKGYTCSLSLHSCSEISLIHSTKLHNRPSAGTRRSNQLPVGVDLATEGAEVRTTASWSLFSIFE
jgi:transposase